MNLWKSLCFRLSGLIHPRMIYGFRRSDGIWLPDTRISNTTHIDMPQKLFIDNNVWIGHFNIIDASGGLAIEEGCQITNYVSLITHSSHIAIRLYGETYQQHKEHIGYMKTGSHIGAYSFIGPHSVLMPGVTLGKGTIVCAHSFVKAGHYPDFAILSGQPAQFIGDTRKKDNVYLNNYPELRPNYEKWSNDSK